jgi:hypothetical protein
MLASMKMFDVHEAQVGHLTIIDSAAENTIVKNLAFTGQSIWIGFNDNGSTTYAPSRTTISANSPPDLVNTQRQKHQAAPTLPYATLARGHIIAALTLPLATTVRKNFGIL